MARSISDEEIQFRGRARRRLVGAVALVLIAVVFLPMVLDKEPKPADQPIVISIPSQDSQAFASAAPAPAALPTPAVAARAPQAAATAARPSPSHSVAAQGKDASPGAVRPNRPAKPAMSATHPTSSKEPVAHQETAHPGAGKPKTAPVAEARFVVQLGAFSNPSNAKQLQTRLSSHGIKSYTEALRVAHGEQTRVRAGPYATRSEAEKAVMRLKAAGIVGVVVPIR